MSNFTQEIREIRIKDFLEGRMRGDLTETYKIIIEFSNYGRHFFSIYRIKMKILFSRKILKIKSTIQLDVFPDRLIFGEKLSNKSNNNITV